MRDISNAQTVLGDTPKPLDNLSNLAFDIGTNIWLVQGAGGNISLKDDTFLWVKASGMWLSDARQHPIFVQLNLLAVLTALAEGKEDLSSAITHHSGMRPSIETSLHALMPQRIVIHIHSINALSWLVRRDGKKAIANRLDGLRWAWIDYVRPGLPLSYAVKKALETTPGATILLMANHGLVVAADTYEDVRTLLNQIEERLISPSPAHPNPTDEDISWLASHIPSGGRLPSNRIIHQLARIPELTRLLDGALYPDHAVFLGSSIPVVAAQQAASLSEALNRYPYCVAVAGEGMILGESFSAGAEAMLECLALLAPCLPKKEDLRYLTSAEVTELTNWDAEKARLQFARTS